MIPIKVILLLYFFGIIFIYFLCFLYIFLYSSLYFFCCCKSCEWYSLFSCVAPFYDVGLFLLVKTLLLNNAAYRQGSGAVFFFFFLDPVFIFCQKIYWILFFELFFLFLIDCIRYIR